MPTFRYKVRQADGVYQTGTMEAPDRRQASRKLHQDGLVPVSLREASAAKRRPSLKNWLPKPKTAPAQASETATSRRRGPTRENRGLDFLKRLLELHASGLPVGDSVRILSQRLSDPELKGLAGALWRDLSEGMTLASAMNRQPKYFSESISFVIEAGEATGNVAPILQRVVEHLDEKREIRTRMIASMVYPALICTVAIGVVILFLTVLLPKIQTMLDRLGSDMTWSARLLIDGSAFLIAGGPFILGGLAVALFGLGQWRRTSAGRRQTDRWLLRAPLFGRIAYYADLFQAGNLIATLMASGINTTETLRLTERTIRNRELRERFRVARNQINEGLSAAQAFRRNAFMPDLSVDVLTVGENTGNLAKSMEEITAGFRHELTTRLSRMTTIISSGALVTAFLLVALVAIGIVTSIFQVSRSLG